MTTLYPYQARVKQLLHEGRSVVLKAPTGSGKTRAALAPFIEAFFEFPEDAFPRQCLYSVPMRVLATQFEREHRGLAESYYRRMRRRLDVRLQTGERPEDPEFMGDLVFATLDQVLSSALGVPYSLSASRANLNVGAVLGSYLVFDEFHLFPHQSMQSTLQLLRALKTLVPFALMTATFSSHMLENIAEMLDAAPVLVSPEEVEQIETRWGEWPRKAREFSVVDACMEPRVIREAHDRRSLVVCNTVDKALEIYEGLLSLGCRPVPFTDPALTSVYEALRLARHPEEHAHWKRRALEVLRERMGSAREAPWVMLLHSRFERPHRQVKEELLQTLWGREMAGSRGGPSLIVVATQVVEVGLDISSQVLHTELAPAASVLQRAGRCARFPGELGRVQVYRVPRRHDGSPNYGPYGGSKEEVAICERTWEVLHERDGMTLHFDQEQEIIDTAHGEADRAMLQAMRENEGRIWELIADALIFGEPSARPELIRKVDSRTVIVYDAPDGLSEESPYCFEGFSLWHGTLRGKLADLERAADEQGIPWTLRYPKPVEEEEESRIPVVYRWTDVQRGRDVSASLLFAVHPRLVTYDAERGFRLGVAGDGTYRSREAVPRGKGREEYGYEMESYADHIRRMRRVFEGTKPGRWEPTGGQLRRRLAWVDRRLAALDGEDSLPPGLLERAVRLVMALHDVGKLDRRWQRWAAKYQEAIGEGVPPFLVAHTHLEPDNPLHKEARQRTQHYKPRTHAGEGAMASSRILWEALEGKLRPGLYRAAVAAIARHHSPSNSEAGAYVLHKDARQAVGEALLVMGEPAWREWARWLIPDQKAPNLAARLPPVPPEGPWIWWFLYFILVRILRLCDSLSQEAV